MLDSHLRLSRTEILTDERQATAAAFLARARTWLAARGITIERVLSDNGSYYRSRIRAATLGRLAHHPEPDPSLPAPTNEKWNDSAAPWRRKDLHRPSRTEPNRTERRSAFQPGSTATTITADKPH